MFQATLNWNAVRNLSKQVLEKGEPLVLTEEVRLILRTTAQQVAIDSEEVEQALQTPQTATELLREMAGRIHDGSLRLSRALTRMYRRRDEGDLEGARQQMREVLAIEVVPHYRELAETSLSSLDESFM